MPSAPKRPIASSIRSKRISVDVNKPLNQLRDWLNSLLHSDWLGTVLIAILLVALTALISHIVTLSLKRFLQSKNGPLPSASIFVNIGRIVVWTLGISITLSSCFNINVGAAITALGIGGIAISLGFQDTLSNLIGGLQIIMTGLVEPGDRIKVSNYEGNVHDVTWRHATILTVTGERVVIPNSLINTQALIKLPPETDIRVPIVITETDTDLETLVADMEKDIDAAVASVAVLETKTSISVSGKTERGYKALVTLSIGQGVKKGIVIDTIMKAISKCAHKGKESQDPGRIYGPLARHHENN